MLEIYRNNDGFTTLALYTCAKSKKTPVDHLHFTLLISAGRFYKEEFEGHVGVVATDSIEAIIDRVKDLYITRVMHIGQECVKNGTTLLQ
jgi:hypothetical protein